MLIYIAISQIRMEVFYIDLVMLQMIKMIIMIVIRIRITAATVIMIQTPNKTLSPAGTI